MPTYSAEPTLARFHACEAIVKGVRGPVGSGKTVAMTAECIRLGAMQPRQRDGVRRSRLVAVRNTYGELQTTTMKTYLDWWEDYAWIRRAPPFEGEFRMVLPDGSEMQQELIFLSVDRPKDIKKLKSLEATVIWLNEASELSKSTLDMSVSRLWRYPSKRDGGASMSSLVMDTNPPDTDHWYYRLAEEGDQELLGAIQGALQKHARDVIPPGMEVMRFFRQPSALLRTIGKDRSVSYKPNPAAENVQNQTLGYGYWLQMLAGKTPDWIKVFVMGEYGAVSSGKPVYPEYVDHWHCATEAFGPLDNLPVLIGADAGLTPAVVLAQYTPQGQLRVFDEICATGVGVRTFMTQVVRPYLRATYPKLRVVDMEGWSDPAAAARSDIDEAQTWQKEASVHLGVEFRPAPTNEYTARRESVAGFLTRTAGGGTPAFMLSPKCKTLRNGFLGKYALGRIEVTGQDRYRDMPLKDMYSHPHDALQYICVPLDWALTGKLERTQRRLANNAQRSAGNRIAVGDGSSGY